MRVSLIFPPVVDPRAPHLALPSLAAHLRQLGVQTDLIDLNIAGFYHVLSPRIIQKAADQLRKSITGRMDLQNQRCRLAFMADHLLEKTPQALALFKQPDTFFNALDFQSARSILMSTLALVSAGLNEKVNYNLLPIRYDVDDIDPQSLSDLISASTDPSANMFHELWTESLYPSLEKNQPDVVGITITNKQQIIPGLILSRAIRARGHFTVLGGTVFTKFVDQLQRLPVFFQHFADGVVIYEGESAFTALLDQLAGTRQFKNVPNFLYLDKGCVRHHHDVVEDVNALLTPDFDGLPLTDYLTPYPVLPILTGKGCYFNRCKFCDIPYINSISRKAYRVRDPEKIAADIDALNQRHNCRHFVITDEALSPKLLLKLADSLQQFPKREYAFTGYARLEPGFTPNVCHRLADMGIKKLFFGLESASQKTQDHMDKGTEVACAPAILKACNDAGIRYHLFSIVGFPQEDEHAARQTYEFFLTHRELINHPGNSFDIHPFGLELRTAYFKQGEILGISVQPDSLAKEFVLGVPTSKWHNPNGLNEQEVNRLLTEFNSGLRKAYSEYHACHDQLWPGFEEFSVLYCDYYQQLDFPYRTNLPDMYRPVSLRWNPELLASLQGEDVWLIGRSINFKISQSLYRKINSLHFGELSELFTGMSDNTAKRLRGDLDALTASGYLQVSCARSSVTTLIGATLSSQACPR